MKTKASVVILLLIISMAVFFYTTGTTPLAKIPTDMGATHLAANYQVQIKLNPNKPKIGNNQLTLFIRDANDQPISNVNLHLYAEMPAMGSMQAMREPVTLTHKSKGLYHGEYALPMAGSWPLSMSITSSTHGNAHLLFDMNTSRQGVKLSQATPSQLATNNNDRAVPEQSLNTFTINHYRRQLIGVTTTTVNCQPLRKTIKAAASVTYNQTKLTDISLKYDAWVGTLKADYRGKSIQRGDILFTVYSPDLISVQNEYLNSLKQHHSQGLRKATKQRLKHWGINNAQIKALAKRGKANTHLPIFSPVNGTLIKKNVVAGSAIKKGAQLLRLADLSTVWVEGEVYQADLPFIKMGMKTRIVFAQRTYTANINFIDPALNPLTRSAIVRVALDNSDGYLKPNMFATLHLQVDLGERLIIPEQAIIFSGEQRIVFVDKGDDRLLPVKIKTGVRNQDMIEVLDGLDWGDTIVSSGNFLIAAESKLKAGLAQW